MTNPASGSFKQLAYKVEAQYGTVPAASGAQALRRVESNLNLNRETYQSNEIRTDQQMADFRHGVGRVEGSLSGELSPLTYSDFIAAALRKAWTATPSASSLTLSVASPTGSVYPLTRGTGSWLTDGFKKGMVIRLTGAGLDPANVGKNLLILDVVSATELSVCTLNGSSLTVESSIGSCTAAGVGKHTYVPLSGHTDQSFSFEHWHSDLTQSEVYAGCKVSKVGLSLPPTGLATIDMDLVGQSLTTAASQYFTTPTAATSTGLLAAVNGKLAVGGSLVANITGFSLDIMSNYSGDPVVGSNVVPFQFAGRVLAEGNMTAYFDSVTLRDLFLNETITDVMVALTTASDADADFIVFALPAIKLGGSQKNDGEGGLVQTIPFQALLDTSGGTGAKTYATTVMVQDSAVP